MGGFRIRVRSTRGAEDGTGGFRGRRAGRFFDVTPGEYARYGPDGHGDDAGLLELVPGRRSPTDAALRLAASRGVDLAAVKSANPTAARITARHVHAFLGRMPVLSAGPGPAAPSAPISSTPAPPPASSPADHGSTPDDQS